MDWRKWSVRHVALKFAYLGWSYSGVAHQDDMDNTIEVRHTVCWLHLTREEHIWKALKLTRLVPEDATWSSVNFARCGRTDKGRAPFIQLHQYIINYERRECFQPGHFAPLEEQDDAGPRYILPALHWRSFRSGILHSGQNMKENEEEIDYVGILNRVLVKDIRIFAWAPVSPDFSARFALCLFHFPYRSTGSLQLEELINISFSARI